MTDDELADAFNRLYGMMQHLLYFSDAGIVRDPQAARTAANHREVEEGPHRGVVTLGDALDAVLGLAAVIDEATQEGLIPRGRGVWAAALLMLIRVYFKPLPADPRPDGDPMQPDMVAVLAHLREGLAEGGIQGQQLADCSGRGGQVRRERVPRRPVQRIPGTVIPPGGPRVLVPHRVLQAAQAAQAAARIQVQDRERVPQPVRADAPHQLMRQASHRISRHTSGTSSRLPLEVANRVADLTWPNRAWGSVEYVHARKMSTRTQARHLPAMPRSGRGLRITANSAHWATARDRPIVNSTRRNGWSSGQRDALTYHRGITDVRWTYFSPPPGGIGPGERAGAYRIVAGPFAEMGSVPDAIWPQVRRPGDRGDDDSRHCAVAGWLEYLEQTEHGQQAQPGWPWAGQAARSCRDVRL